MTKRIEDNFSNQSLKLPCGGHAYFDFDSGISYRCIYCNAVVGSVGQPQHCQDEAKKWELAEKLGGQGWDYEKGEPNERKRIYRK